jgi:hypothetical protein
MTCDLSDARRVQPMREASAAEPCIVRWIDDIAE